MDYVTRRAGPSATSTKTLILTRRCFMLLYFLHHRSIPCAIHAAVCTRSRCGREVSDWKYTVLDLLDVRGLRVRQYICKFTGLFPDSWEDSLSCQRRHTDTVNYVAASAWVHMDETVRFYHLHGAICIQQHPHLSISPARLQARMSNKLARAVRLWTCDGTSSCGKRQGLDRGRGTGNLRFRMLH